MPTEFVQSNEDESGSIPVYWGGLERCAAVSGSMSSTYPLLGPVGELVGVLLLCTVGCQPADAENKGAKAQGVQYARWVSRRTMTYGGGGATLLALAGVGYSRLNLQ